MFGHEQLVGVKCMWKQMKAKPALDLGMLVGRVVHVDLFFGRDDVVDNAQDLQAFPAAVPVVAHGNDFALHSMDEAR